MSKYSTIGNRKLIAMIIGILSLLLVLYSTEDFDKEVRQTTLWGIVSVTGAFMGTNLIKHGMDQFGSHERNKPVEYDEGADY